jgi:lipopolysaccharide export system permease protein
VLRGVETIIPPTFRHSASDRLELNIRQDLGTFKTFEPRSNTSEIELIELYNTIKRLEQAGTNVEAMRMDLYGRFSYAGSILVMGILALAISMRIENVYAGVLLSLVCTFLFYATNIFFSAMGENGTLVPYMAAWAANAIFASAGTLSILSYYINTIKRKL